MRFWPLTSIQVCLCVFQFRILWPSKAKIDEALETMKVEEAKLKEMKKSQNAATKEALVIHIFFEFVKVD